MFKPDSLNPEFASLRILVAEDNQLGLLLIQKWLQKLGVHPCLVANGAEAVQACEQTPFDVIFMDIHMPIMDGIEATRQIRRAGHQHVAIAAITASESAINHRAALAAGVNGFLKKPVTIEMLQEFLLSVVRASKNAS